jgi:hypothetical protein
MNSQVTIIMCIRYKKTGMTLIVDSIWEAFENLSALNKTVVINMPKEVPTVVEHDN